MYGRRKKQLEEKISKSIRMLFKPKKKENEVFENRIIEILGHMLNKKIIIINQ